MGALNDCERLIGDLIGQPVNSATTLAFVFAGYFVAKRSHRSILASALVATGVGSVLFHGPMPSYAEWAHDVTLAWLLVAVALEVLGFRWVAAGLGLVGLAGLFAMAPAAADPIAAALAGVAVIVVLVDGRRAAAGPLALLGASAVVGRLGATGGPLCSPESILQPHGVWHLAAAAAVVWWAETRFGPMTRETPRKLWPKPQPPRGSHATHRESGPPDGWRSRET